MTKRRITTGRIAVAFAALCMTLWAGMAAAQERFTGQWRFERQDTGAVLMTFDLYEQRGSVAGISMWQRLYPAGLCWPSMWWRTVAAATVRPIAASSLQGCKTRRWDVQSSGHDRSRIFAPRQYM